MESRKQRLIRSAIVTGPTGALGAALCHKLLEEGVFVYAVCHPDSTRKAVIPSDGRLEVIELDLSAYQELEKKVSSADAFFHLAWKGTTGAARNDLDMQIQNIQGAVDAVKAAAQTGCRVFIGAGSQAEYGRVDEVLRPDTPEHPETGYGIAKLCAGEMTRLACQKMDIDHIWFRILSLYGPHDQPKSMVMSTILKLLKREKPILTPGEQIWDYLYAEDAAEALYLAARYGKNEAIYPLGSGRGIPLKEYVTIIRDAIDPSLPLGIGELPYNPNQVMHLEADIGKLQEDTGFTPHTSFQEGIEKTIRWVKEDSAGNV